MSDRLDPTLRVVAALEAAGCEPMPCGEAQWESRCPAHGGGRKNLSVAAGDNGGALVHCHHDPACSAEEIVSALGLTMSDLSPPKVGAKPKRQKKEKVVWDSLNSAVQNFKKRNDVRAVGYWVYRDAAGAKVMAVVRYDIWNPRLNDGAGGVDKTYRPFHAVSGGWVSGDPAGPLPLYRLDELPTEGRVYFTEGEKGVDAVRAICLASTTTAHGARSPHKSDMTPLAGREVVILPDNDDEGEGYAIRVAGLLMALSPPAEVRIVRPPAAIAKGDDVVEYIGTRRSEGRGDEEIRAELEALADAAQVVAREEIEAEDGSEDLDFDAALPEDPFRIAEDHLDGYWLDDDLGLRYWRGEFLEWRDARWASRDLEEIKAEAGGAMRAAVLRINARAVSRKEMLKTSSKMQNDVLMALKTLTIMKTAPDQTLPCWIGEPPLAFPADEFLPTRNALVHLPSFVAGRRPATVDPTPRFFCRYALGYDFDPEAGRPSAFFDFLDSIWDYDPESVAALQEWIGYLLMPDISLQKILFLVGPTRSGKGTIGRILTALIGAINVSGLTLSQLATNFGLSSLLGKQVAIVGDARFAGPSDQVKIIVERLLSISGGDMLNVDRKYLPALDVQLPTRLVLLSNELPALKDDSGALADRFIVLKFTRSFLGREDTELIDRILPHELPGILLWAIEGWRRLMERKRFIQPATGQEDADEMKDLTSPVGAFVRECCDVGPSFEASVSDVFAAWEKWCRQDGRAHPGTKQVFGKRLKAAVPGISAGLTRDRSLGVQFRRFKGIQLRAEAVATLGYAEQSAGYANGYAAF